MAHSCPECGLTCYCCGDIDDINFGESSHCRHYRDPQCDGHEEYSGPADDDEDDPDPDGSS